ncbi:M48 family peptidase [Nocardioides sp. zg-579]|uniref:M48 family peptidase n=1 Tax=Nocardioides marmotae TaxID=2663857 RepID=A0A6I3JE83_9ACTN|nr:SprT-like domain-containing protein [Nocardioides marmotae]MCR6032800.1 M48 family peptidase [Gordonia jinghuaiqii]MTB96450.1 M48 family peptidase [Nocardioides marmotae]QKE02025.1 M48 family peptidase [Nocardioides marmotae]
MDLDEAARMARGLLDEHGLRDWTVVFDRAKRRAGICRPAQRQIGLSGPLTALHDEAEVRDTVLHEVAHALVGPRHGHDAVWRATAVRIGCSGRRCSDPDAPAIEGDWVGTCPGGHRITRHRRPTRPGSCTRCSRTFSREHLLTWTHRGTVVPMGEAYDAALRRILDAPDPGRSAAGAPAPAPRVGQRARIVAAGRYQGVVGTVLKRGRTRFHLRVRGQVLTVPFAMLEPLDRS